MSAILTTEEILKLVGEMFVYRVLFSRTLGPELEHYEKESAQLTLSNRPMMAGNWAQGILHDDVIVSTLGATAGLICIEGTLTRHGTISEDELCQQMSHMGTTDLRVDYPYLGRGSHFTATSSLLRASDRVVVTRVELCNEEQLYITNATTTYMVG